jgi:hypothetical protein
MDSVVKCFFRFCHHAVKSPIIIKCSKRDTIKVAVGTFDIFYGLIYDSIVLLLKEKFYEIMYTFTA